ncbi:aldehyde dehydrogenase family protein [Peristeroidobacter soli]|uniref:aldehyde dehydrogenase family protein n=1 Tax=Peristeroidobacter soli TaxID=2497877 RepID=UPI00101C268D|nr:aldehyde dehydrogenase family protein [Peristeroidobacter soli]
MNNRHAIYIDGRWLQIQAPSFCVSDAATGEPMTSICLASAEHVNLAVRSAQKALPIWAAATPEQRSHVLNQIADGLEARATELAHVIAREVGMPLRLCEMIQVAAPIAAWRSYAGLAAQARNERSIGHSLVIDEPVGVVAAITPWNYPLHQITAKVAAALAAGATVVLKPSEIAPSSALILAEIIDGSDLPAGAFNMLTGLGSEVGTALVEHPDVTMVSFTGSTETGKHVAALASRGIKRLSLELGGKSPAVVLEGADLTQAVKSTLASCLLNSGQTCNALTRLIVPEARFEAVAQLLRELLPKYIVGDPMERTTRMGPLVSEQQRRRVTAFVDDAIRAGIPVIARGNLPEQLTGGFFFAPIVFGPAPEHCALVQQEIFGPVLTVQTHQGVDDAVRLANGTPFGLAAAVWADTDETAIAVARRIRAGQIDLNGAPFNLAAPFGGFGASGLGRENGEAGLSEFLETKSLQRKATA